MLGSFLNAPPTFKRSGATSLHSLDRQCDALAAPDAQSDEASGQAVAAHGVDQAGDEDSAGGADRMAVRDGPALDVDDLLLQAQFTRHHNGNGGEGFVDLDALDRADVPAGALQSLLHGGKSARSSA